MLFRSQLFFILLAAVAFAENKTQFHQSVDGPIPQPTARSTTKVITNPTPSEDVILSDIEYLKGRYQELRGELDDWMKDPFHRNVLMPAGIGAAAGLLSVVLCFIIKCCCKKCFRRRNSFCRRAGKDYGQIPPRRSAEDY